MLNEMLIGNFVCPVCERILYGPLRGWWCPYCGTDLKHKAPIEYNLAESRLTQRSESGMPYYAGKFTFRERCFPQDMSLSAIAEVLEKLAQYEDAEEQKEEENGDTEES